MKEIKRIIKEFINYDNVYYNGKLTNLVIIILCGLGLLLLVIASQL